MELTRFPLGRLVLTAALIVLAACSTPAPRPEPAPEAAPPAQSPAASPATPAPARQEGAPPAPESGTGRAVTALLVQASRAERAGDLGATETYLERALRIEPGNASLWHYMARLRLVGGANAQAAQLAARSNSLAQGDRPLQRENWRLISEARRRAGDLSGAREAATRAEALSP